MGSAHLLLFPYALAEVCPDWKLDLLERPYYWTHVVLSVDYECTTLLEDAEEIFQITAPRFLEVLIGHYRTVPDSNDDPELEKKHVKRFTDLLLQNLPCCRKISIYVHSHDLAPKSDHFEGHPRPSNEYTLSMIGKGSSVTHSWCDEIAPRWR